MTRERSESELPTIRTKIKKDLTAEISVEGMPGCGCTDLTKGLEEALGGRTDQVLTDEFYEDDDRVDHHQDQEADQR